MDKNTLIEEILSAKNIGESEIDSGIISRLNTGNYPLHNNGALPILNDRIQYNEVLYKRYLDVKQRFFELTNGADINTVYQRVLMTMSIINNIEGLISDDLEKLSIEIIKNEFDIKDDEVIFDVELLRLGEVKPPSGRVDDIDRDQDEYPPSLDEEIRKRDFINALTQGASKKGHYIFALYEDIINGYNRMLPSLYKELVSANDLMYFLMSDEQVKAAASNDSAQAGYVKLTFVDGKPKIEVKAVCFPFIIHELIKGVMELLSTLALPEAEQQKEVMSYADDLGGELWGIRLGPVYWENLMSCIDVENKDILKLIIAEIYKLPTSEFNEFFKEINLQTDSAIERINSISKIIRARIAEYEEYMAEQVTINDMFSIEDGDDHTDMDIDSLFDVTDDGFDDDDDDDDDDVNYDDLDF